MKIYNFEFLYDVCSMVKKSVNFFFTIFQGQTKYKINRKKFAHGKKGDQWTKLLDQSILLASLDIIDTIKR